MKETALHTQTAYLFHPAILRKASEFAELLNRGHYSGPENRVKVD
jgi:hypothetical protein